MKKIETIKHLIVVHRCDLRVPGAGLTGVIGNKETTDIHTGRLGLMDWRAHNQNVKTSWHGCAMCSDGDAAALAWEGDTLA